jgi:ribosomal protein S18 acetylase RimI-like enzyme
MVDVLPPGLGDVFAVSAVTSADIVEVHDLVVAEETALLGHCHETLEDVRAWLQPPAGADSRQLLVRDIATGELKQLWYGDRSPGDPRFELMVRTHPAVSVRDGDDLTRAAWRVLLPWVKELCREGGPREVLVHSGCVNGDAPALRRLLEAGFVHERTFWEMTAAVADEPPRDTAVPGLVIKPARPEDHRIVHRLMMEGFAEHWGFEPTSFDDWLAGERCGAGYDPDLWLLAEVDAQPAAAMILSRRAAADNGLYVREIATLPAYRRRGIASALLHAAFDVARAQGYDHIVLHVDSDSAVGAPSVYRRAGFEVRDAFNACLLRLRVGEDGD